MTVARRFRIGSVPHLNARPLIYGIEACVRFEPPFRLALSLRAGRFDAALLPVAACLETPGYRIVSNVAISSRGEVRSVILAHRVPLSKVRVAMKDPTSRTSNLLARVILKEFYGADPRWVRQGTRTRVEARVMIGDAALRERPRLEREGWSIVDLGALWQVKTRRPFVYAVWAVRPRRGMRDLADLFRGVRRRGLRKIHEIAAAQDVLPFDEARDYLTRCIRYNLGSSEKRGLLCFQELCVRHGFLPRRVKLNFLDPQPGVARTKSLPA